MRIEADTSRAARMLAEVRARALDMTPLLQALTEEAQVMAEQAFASERSPAGRAWAPRAEESRAAAATLGPVRAGRLGAAARRARSSARQSGNRLLYSTGALAGSISVYLEGPRTLVLWASSDHAAVHQWGSRKAGIPARPFFPMSRRGPVRSGPGGQWLRLLPGRVRQWITRGIA
jgi:phage gpG-like protein